MENSRKMDLGFFRGRKNKPCPRVGIGNLLRGNFPGDLVKIFYENSNSPGGPEILREASPFGAFPGIRASFPRFFFEKPDCSCSAVESERLEQLPLHATALRLAGPLVSLAKASDSTGQWDPVGLVCGSLESLFFHWSSRHVRGGHRGSPELCTSP